MQVQKIQSNNYKSYNSPKFGALNVTKTGQKMIDSWYGSKEKWQKINLWKKELANTKFFDLEIDELCKGLFMIIKSKNSESPNCEAPLRVHDEPKKNMFWAFGTDLIDCGDWVSYPLEFATNKDAESAYNTLRKYQHGNSMPTIEKMQWAVDSVKILEKSTEYLAEPKVTEDCSTSEIKTTRLPFLQRLKNTWSALNDK